MVNSCSAYNCTNSGRSLPKKSFHRYPLKNPSLLAKWVAAVRRANYKPTAASTLCSDHFTPDDYQLRPAAEIPLLKNTAVPSLFNFPPHMQRSAISRRLKRKQPSAISDQEDTRDAPSHDHSYNTSDEMLSSVRRLSTSAALRSSKLYELRIYSFKPSNLKIINDLAKVAMPTRFNHSPCLGYFFSEIGGLGESVHIWEYDSYGQRAGLRQKLGADPFWTASAKPMIEMFEKQDNSTMRLYPWSHTVTDVSPGGVYLFYSFTFLPEVTAESMSLQLQNFVKDSGLTTLGVWKEELGKDSLRNAYAVFQSADYDSLKNPGLACGDAWDQLKKYTSRVHGRLLTPADFSTSLPWH